MPDELTESDVDRIAALAHLELTAEERSTLRRQLAEILAFAEQLGDIDTTGVAATAHVLQRHPALRPDDPAPSLSRDAALANAPDADREAGFFKVPRVIG